MTDWLTFCFAVFMAWVTICLVVCFVGWVLWAVMDWRDGRKLDKAAHANQAERDRMNAAHMADEKVLREIERNLV